MLFEFKQPKLTKHKTKIYNLLLCGVHSMNISTTTASHNPDSSSVFMRRKIAILVRKLSEPQLHAILFHAESFFDSDNIPLQTSLSHREKEVLLLLSEGYSRRQIGQVLNISINTAAKHIASIYRKIEVTTVAEATRFALLNKSVFA